MQTMENRWTRGAIPALLIHCSIGTVYCWSSFSAALAEKLGTTPSLLGWAFSIAIFVLGMSAAFAGSFVEKDIHKSSLIAAVFFAFGMLGMGLTIQFSPQLGSTLSIILIFLCYGGIMGIGTGIGYLTPVKTLMLWFEDKKGLGTGISIMGFGLAKAIASPIMNALQNSIGLAKMFYLLAAVYFIMMMLGHFLLKKPAGYVEPNKKWENPFKIFKNPTFTAIWIMFYLNVTSGLALISYEKSILQLAGFGMAGISILQSCTAATNALGRIGFSTISDHCKDRNTIFRIIFGMSLIVTALCLVTNSIEGGLLIPVAVLLLLINAGYGGGFSTLPALISSRFGMENLSTIYGTALTAWALAGLTGNQLTALSLTHFGSYRSVLIILSIMYLTAFLLSLFVTKEKPAKN